MIRKLTITDAPVAAQLHKQGMPNDFLPSFGLPFLTILHKYLITSDLALAYGYETKNRLEGIIVGTVNTDKLMGQIYTLAFWKFLPYVILKILGSPRTIYYFWQTLFYGKHELKRPEAELIVLAISAKVRRKGIGSKLMNALKQEFKKRKIYSFSVGTLSTNNGANQFYKKHEGKYVGQISIYERQWNIYFYDLNGR